MTSVTPYIAFKGTCKQAIEFYRTAVGAEVVFVQTYGTSPMAHMGPADYVMHATIKVGTTNIMLCDDARPEAPEAGGNISLAIGLNDPAHAHQLFDNLARGGTVLMPLTKTYWADAFGMLIDPFGVRWMINSEAPHPEKS